MATDTDRREVARKLRELPDNSTYPDLIGAIADHDGWYAAADAADRLADLIDPTCEARRDALFYPATGLTPEHEETVYRCGECGEIISYDEGYDPETDLPAYCERCGSRITGIGEPWDE